MAESKGKGISHLVRQVAQDAKQKELATFGGSDPTANIFSILEYIEQPWGLAMKLRPAQRFLVKLYYNIELDSVLPEDPLKRIQISDMFNTRILYEFTELEYLKYLYNEGRCNIGAQDHDRRELILSIGRRGGKCVTGDTMVLTNEGVKFIEDMAEAPEEGFTPLTVSVAQEGKKRAQSAYFYNGGVKKVFKVTTASGYTLSGTANHRIKVMSEAGTVQWGYQDQLRVGTCVAIHRGTDLWASEYVNVEKYHNTDGRKDFDLPDVVDERWGKLLGYLVGDGSWSHTQGVAMTVEHPETWDFMKALFTELFGSYRVQMDKRTDNTGRLECPGIQIRRFLDALGWTIDTDRYGKRIPWVILRSPKSVVCAFLRGLFETDGSAEGGGRRITFSTASERLATEVQLLMLNLGIVSTVVQKWNKVTKRTYSHLQVKGVRSRRLFAQIIGFDSEKKTVPMLAALEVAQEGKSDTESIPCQYNHLRDLLEKVPKNKSGAGWVRSKLREAMGNTVKPSSGEDLSYTRLNRLVSVAKELGVEGPEVEHFQHLADLDYFYDPIVSIVEGEEQVYDLNVPEGAAFVANGMVNHNTTLSGIFASYEVYRLLNMYNPQAYYGLPNGNRIQIISVATDKEQAGLLFNEVTTHVAKCDYFNPYVSNNTLTHVNFRTPYDIAKFGPAARHDNGKFVSLNGKATIRVTFKSCIAKGLRGSGNIMIIMDEAAHFQDKGASSAEEVYNAVVPSSAAYSRKDPASGMPLINPETGKKAPVESRIIMISSPLGKSGKFYEKFDLAMRAGEGSENILAVQAPTWEINPTITDDYYRNKYHENPQVFMVEHGAQFSDQARGWIERKEDLQKCIVPMARPKLSAPPRMPHQMGIDVGLVGDGTAVAITHVEGDKIVHDYHEVWYAGIDWRESNPHLERHTVDYARTLADLVRLDFDALSEWIEVLCKRFYISSGIFDRWNGIPLEQSLHKKGLKQFKSEFFTRDQASKIYQTAKMYMFDERLVLYDHPIPEVAKGGEKHSPLISELLALQANHVSKNIVLVEAPKKVGSHDDLSDALMRAIWLSSETISNQKHISHGSSSITRPHVGSVMNPQRYQLSRARSHGVSDRSVFGRRSRVR